MKNSKELPNSLNQLYLKALRKNRVCQHEGCANIVSGNHCVSESQLRSLAIDGHVREMFLDPWKPELILKKSGVEHCTLFRLFCGKHDNEYYFKIDVPGFELDSYDNIIKLNHRALHNELYKKIVRRETYIEFSSKYSHIKANGVLRAKRAAEDYDFNLKSLQWFLDSFKIRGAFYWEIFRYPYIEVATSELFTFEPEYVSDSKRAMFQNVDIIEPLSELFIHIIPREEEEATFLIISSHEKHKSNLIEYRDRFIDMKLSEKFSDILLLHLENWVCSESFYNNYFRGKSYLEKSFNESMDPCAYNRKSTWNLFND